MSDDDRGGVDPTERDLEALLAAAIEVHADETGDRVRICTFAEAGVLTMNKGLVVRFGDAEFQVTIRSQPLGGRIQG